MARKSRIIGLFKKSLLDFHLLERKQNRNLFATAWTCILFPKTLKCMNFIIQNYMRVVEVWLDDEHREYFYTREPSVRGYPVGDISKQLKFKQDHKCKDFKWFMENVAYEVYDRFPKLPPNKAWGEVKSYVYFKLLLLGGILILPFIYQVLIWSTDLRRLMFMRDPNLICKIRATEVHV